MEQMVGRLEATAGIPILMICVILVACGDDDGSSQGVGGQGGGGPAPVELVEVLDSLPQYPGLALDSDSDTSGVGAGFELGIGYTAPGSTADVLGFYAQRLPEMGWKQDGEIESYCLSDPYPFEQHWVIFQRDDLELMILVDPLRPNDGESVSLGVTIQREIARPQIPPEWQECSSVEPSVLPTGTTLGPGEPTAVDASAAAN